MDPAKMKVVDLRSELGALGLDTKGNKPALVERLKKALEAKSGKSIADTTILDTSTEDVEDTPKRPGPAARTRRRSSSLRHASTPAKQPRRESPEPIPEVKDDDLYSPGASSPEPEKLKTPEPVKQKTPEKPKSPSPVREPSPEPSPELSPQRSPEPPVEDTVMKTPEKTQEKSPAKALVEKSPGKKTPKKHEEISHNEPEQPSEPETNKEAADGAPEPMDQSETPAQPADSEDVIKQENTGQEGENAGSDKGDKKRERKSRFADREPQRELTEEEEWDLFNERLLEREKERVEREKKQAEEDAKKLEELANDPIKFKRLQRKYEKKQRWNNYYRNIEVTNEILTPPTEDDYAIKGQKQGAKGKKDGAQADIKAVEPELDDSKITLSWYDSDLNQYLHLPDLNEVSAMNDGAFAHAWAGARASHGVTSGRVCFEVKVGAAITTTEVGEKDPLTSSLRIGWSTADQSLHLGEGERSWAFESNGRAVHNSEFKEFGKEMTEKDVVGAYVDLESNPCTISYTLNGVELGVAYEFDKNVLEGKALFPHVLTKSMCYRVNLGYDRYNMLTKTKIVRNRLEIPVKQVLEEKRKREEELQRAKDEAERKEKERKEKERLEREERQRKKKEEREKQDRERKEKEAAERREKGEEDKEKDAQANGDKAAETVEVKQEPPEDEEMTVAPPPPPPEPAAPAEPAPAEVKDEPVEAAESTETPAEVTEEQVLGGHVLDERIQFVIRYTADEELDGVMACLLPGYILIAQGSLVQGPTRPASLAECEVILMVGMPGAGKSHWVKQRVAAFPDKRYNVLSTGALFDKMKVDCKPFKACYEGRWDAMVSKTAKCVLKLVEVAHGRRRNFILDQTNVYPSAQRRKLREFDGYRRIAVAVVTDEETYKQRCQQRESADGKEVPDAAILDMKANFSLPEKSSWLDEVIFPELNEEEAKKVVESFHKEAKAAGVLREKEKRERSAGRDAPASKRQRSQDKRHGRDDRGRSRDSRENREDRWGGGGGNRWGNNNRGGGGGGNRWGRDRSSSQNNRFGGGGDRPWGNGPQRGDYNNRDRDNFRGGPGGRPPMPGGGPRGPPGPPIGDRFNRDRNNRPPPQGGDRDKRGPPGPQGPPPTGGGGSWQRGGQIQNNRGGPGNRGGGNNRNPKDGNQPQQQPGWNQWAGGWGGWGGNWNQNQQQQQQQAAAGWNNWQNWQNWNQAAAAGGQPGQPPAAAPGGKSAPPAQQQQQQWPANYTAQQWYQWQQWQQQQQNWAGYQQQQQQQQQPGQANQAANTQEAQNAWAQYYQNYGNAAASAAVAAAAPGGDKKT